MRNKINVEWSYSDQDWTSRRITSWKVSFIFSWCMQTEITWCWCWPCVRAKTVSSRCWSVVEQWSTWHFTLTCGFATTVLIWLSRSQHLTLVTQWSVVKYLYQHYYKIAQIIKAWHILRLRWLCLLQSSYRISFPYHSSNITTIANLVNLLISVFSAGLFLPVNFNIFWKWL